MNLIGPIGFFDVEYMIKWGNDFLNILLFTHHVAIYNCYFYDMFHCNNVF